MTIRPQHGGGSSAARDVANLGLVHPPLVYLTSLVSGAVIHLAMPLALLPGTLACASRRGCHSVVFLLGCEIPGSRHASARAKAHRSDRPHGPVSLQPKPDLSGVLRVPARYRDLGQ